MGLFWTIGISNYGREAAAFFKATNNNNYGREAAAFSKATNNKGIFCGSLLDNLEQQLGPRSGRLLELGNRLFVGNI